MSLEQKIELLIEAVNANTAALLGQASSAAVKGSVADTEAPKQTRRKPAAAKKEEVVDDLDLDDSAGGDGLDDLDLGLDEEEPAPSKIDGPTLKAKMSELAKSKGREAALGVFKKFGANTFDGLKADQYGKIHAEVVKLLGA